MGEVKGMLKNLQNEEKKEIPGEKTEKKKFFLGQKQKKLNFMKNKLP